MTTSSIGSAGGRTYSTIAAWEAAAPADITASGTNEIWLGECYNDSEFVITSGIVISGTTTDATHYLHLTAAAGESFADNASKLTNALRYNVSNGVGIKNTGGYVTILTVSEAYFYADRLQLLQSTQGYVVQVSFLDAAILSQLIVETQQYYVMMNLGDSASQLINCLIISNYSGAAQNAVSYGYAHTGSGIYNCTIVRPSDLAPYGYGATGISASSGYPLVVKNTAVFGFATTASAITYAAGSDYNAVADSTSPFGGAHDQTSAVYADQFQNVLTASRDYRAK